MKPITLEQVYSLREARQFFHDCYLVSSVNALTRCENGRKLLQRNIASCSGNFNVRFNNLKGKSQDFYVSRKDLKNLEWTDRYRNPILINGNMPEHHPVIKAIECAMDKLLQKYPAKKPLICRLVRCNERFEYNKPSNFMSMFTGEKPIILNEGGISLTLKKKQEEAFELFERMDKENEFSFVVGTSLNNDIGLTNTHCYTVEGVNFNRQYMEVWDNRLQRSHFLAFSRVIRGIKFVTGYFNYML